MTPDLLQRYPKFENIGRVELGNWPTPLVHAQAFQERYSLPQFLVKRDDLSGTSYGGNKIRKLEYLLHDAKERGYTRLISAGGVGSNHLLATGIYGSQLGFKVSGIVFRQPITDGVKNNIRCCGATGMRVVLSRVAMLPAALATEYARSRIAKEKPLWIPPGGSNALGTLGWLSAVFELKKQLTDAQMPDPQAIYLAFGSGSTAAGLLLGVSMLNMNTDICAVHVLPSWMTPPRRIIELAGQTKALLAAHDPHFANLRVHKQKLKIVANQVGKGYGYPTPRCVEAVGALRACEGINIDWTYAGKALAAVISRRHKSDRPVLFWNTYSSADLTPLLANAQPHLQLSEGLNQLLRKPSLMGVQ